VQTNKYPGFPATPGSKRIEYWVRQAVGTPSASMRVEWLDGSGTLIRADIVGDASADDDLEAGDQQRRRAGRDRERLPRTGRHGHHRKLLITFRAPPRAALSRSPPAALMTGGR
jgi:hypothetical protein